MRKHKSDAPHRRKIAIVVVATVMPVAVATYFFVLSSFNATEPTLISDEIDNGIVIHGRVLSIDPSEGAMTVRLRFGTRGQYQDQDARLAVPVTLFVTTAKGDTEIPFAAGGFMSPVEVTIGFERGRVTDYPFDNYRSFFSFFFLPQSVPRGSALVEADVIPTQLQLVYGAHGFDIDINDELEGVHLVRHDQVLDVRVHRSLSTRFFAWFVMVLMGALALASLAIVVVLTYWGRAIGPGVLGYLAALLFAFPAVRSVMPGSPPIGSYSDYLAFFWSEAIVAATLLVLAIIWLAREVRAGASASDVDGAIPASGPPPGPPPGPQPPPPTHTQPFPTSDPPASSRAGPARRNYSAQ